MSLLIIRTSSKTDLFGDTLRDTSFICVQLRIVTLKCICSDVKSWTVSEPQHGHGWREYLSVFMGGGGGTWWRQRRILDQCAEWSDVSANQLEGPLGAGPCGEQVHGMFLWVLDRQTKTPLSVSTWDLRSNDRGLGWLICFCVWPSLLQFVRKNLLLGLFRVLCASPRGETL